MPRGRRLIQGTGIVAVVGLVLTACGDAGFDQAAATKVLQSVDVNLDADGSIAEVDSSAVYLDELSGESDSSEDSFAAEDVVGELPVRVTTQYETEEDSGSNLEDLEGHSGRVAIDVTVENLTLDSSELTYDVAGESRETSALVGTPLSVAGSIEMEGIGASDVVLDPESDSSTNGVVSQNAEGDAIVQWGTVLAPPQSEATTTFQLVAEVDDFSAPDFDLAIQPGFHTDMSFEGMVSAAFDTSATSEYGTQQEAIELVADVNDVLTRAGTTITDIRTTLDHTTETLGEDAVEHLQQNSDDMAAEMESVGEQLAALESQVEGSMTGAETAMDSQLSQIVASMNDMMGDTEASAPQLKEGEGCAATVEEAEANGSLYSTFLVLGAQLDGYAEANAECRDAIVSEIESTLGPETPDAETCDVANDSEVSITCALFDAQNSVLTSLDDLVDEGDRIIEELDTQVVADAKEDNDNLREQLTDINTQLTELDDDLSDTEQWDENLAAVQEALSTAQDTEANLGSVHQQLNDSAIDAKEHLTARTEAMRAQQVELADDMCELKTEEDQPESDDDPDEEEIPAEEVVPVEELPESPENQQVEEFRAELVNTHCLGYEKEDVSEEDTLVGQLDAQLAEQNEAWDAIIEHIDYDGEGSELKHLQAILDELDENVDAVEGGVQNDTDLIKNVVDDLQSVHDDALEHQDDLENALDALEEEQTEKLPEQIRTAFEDVAEQAADELPENVDEQVRIVSDRVNGARDSVIESYNSTVSGLATTSDAVTNETSEQIEEQQSTLESQQEETSNELNETTTAVIEGIHESTVTSTRDIDGASAQLDASLSNVILDLGDPDVEGSGILGSIASSSAMSDTADYQLALASQRAAGYANVRTEDIAEIMLRQAQFSASLDAAATLPAFHLDVPSGAESQTVYAFHIVGGDNE